MSSARQGARAELHGVCGHQLAADHFSEYVDLGFTARMEDLLDAISNGRAGPRPVPPRYFYFGGGDEGRASGTRWSRGRHLVPGDRRGRRSRSGQPIVVRIGRGGPFLQRTDGDDSPDRIAARRPRPGRPHRRGGRGAARRAAAGAQQLGVDPATGSRLPDDRPYGPYVQLGETPGRVTKANRPPRASLPAGVTEANLTLNTALKLLALPRLVGRTPTTGSRFWPNFGASART